MPFFYFFFKSNCCILSIIQEESVTLSREYIIFEKGMYDRDSASTVKSVIIYAWDIRQPVNLDITSARASSPPQAPPFFTTIPTPIPTKTAPATEAAKG